MSVRIMARVNLEEPPLEPSVCISRCPHMCSISKVALSRGWHVAPLLAVSHLHLMRIMIYYPKGSTLEPLTMRIAF